MRFVSSGLACVDYIASLETYPEENTKNVSQGTLVTFGGNAANMACGLSMMGEAVQLATVLYADPNGAFIESELLKHGVALTPSVRVAGNAGMSYIATCEDTASRTMYVNSKTFPAQYPTPLQLPHPSTCVHCRAASRDAADRHRHRRATVGWTVVSVGQARGGPVSREEPAPPSHARLRAAQP